MGKLKLISGPPNVHRFLEGSSQSFYEGDLLKVSAGYVVIATDGNDAWGVSTKKASGTKGTVTPVMVLTPEQTWSVYTTGTPAQATHPGNGYDLTGFTAGNNLTLNLSVTTNKDCIVQALDPRDTAASGSRVLVRFNYASSDAIGG